MSIITNWTDGAADFGRRSLVFNHNLHERPMFDDAGLESLLDRYPRERLGVYTMGEDPRAWRTWRRGSPGRMTGSQLLEAAKAGRIWLNLRAANAFLPEYRDLAHEIFAEKAKATRRTFLKKDLGVLISSADAQVFYHLDIPLVTLWQIRGQKRVHVYPPRAPYVTPEDLERIVLRETDEQFAFDPAWDEGSEIVDLRPGTMVTWSQNAPHRIVNGPMLNVSLSIEFMTPEALMRANVIYANGVLRRRLGVRPGPIEEGLSPAALAKVGIARLAKALKLQTPHEAVLPESFRLDEDVPGRLIAAA